MYPWDWSEETCVSFANGTCLLAAYMKRNVSRIGIRYIVRLQELEQRFR